MSESFSYSFDFQLSIKDAVSCVKYHAKSPYRMYWPWIIWLGVIPLVVIIWVLIDSRYNLWIVLSALIVSYTWSIIVYYLFYNPFLTRLIKTKSLQYGIDMPQTLKINNDQIINRIASNEIVLLWNEIEHILNDKNHVYMYLNPKKVIILPKRLFKDKAESDAFIKKAMEAHAAARKNPGGVA